MDNLDILPPYWEKTKLGEFVISEKGKKPKNISNKRTSIHKFPYVNIKAFEKGIVDEFTDGAGCTFCNEGDFLMVWDGSRSGYIGKAIKGAIGSTLVKLTFPGLVQKYAYYFLQSKFIEINTKAKGVGIPHVDPYLLWNYILPIPSFKEQERIVSKIEKLFSDLDKGIESLKTAQQQLKVYRQAVLKWAFDGRFTNSSISEGELPKGWKWVLLKELTTAISDGDHQPPPKSKNGIPFITISNIRHMVIDFSDTFFVDEEYYNSLKKTRRPDKGDILYTVTGSFGIPVFIDFEKKFCFQRHIGLIRPASNIIQKWLFYALQSDFVLKQAKKVATGTAQKTVSLDGLRNFRIPLCSPVEQIKMVQEIESRFSVCDKIEESIEISLKQAEALRQSILKKAFDGKLVPQDPNDEPASELLKRIQAEKVSAAKGKINTKLKKSKRK